MEELLDNNHLKSQNLGKGNNRRILKRNYERNALILQSAKLHKLSKRLFQLKVIKSTNRTTAKFFSTNCYRRLKIPKRRRQFNVVRVAILFLLSIFVYLYWWHRTLEFEDIALYSGESDVNEDYVKKYRTNESLEPYKVNVNLKQIEETKTNNRQDDQKDLYKDLIVDLERQHLYSQRTNDRSSSKFHFNTKFEPIKLINEIEKDKDSINKEITRKKIQNNDHTTREASSASSTRTSLPAPGHQYHTDPVLKNYYSFLGNSTTNLPALKNNQSSSVSSRFPVERRKNSKSILEKQVAWYEFVGITMFNLLGSSLAGQNLNRKFKNHSTIRASKIQSKPGTTIPTEQITSSIHANTFDSNNNKISAIKQPTATVRQPNRSNQTLSLIKNLERRLPECIIIGVRKAGTRAVLEYLSLNDHIRKADNEVHFFDNDERYALGLDYYRNQMPLSTPGQITIEKSPAYFVTSSVPDRISKSMNKTIKLILIVRDPVIRLVSDYTQLLHNKLLKLDDLMRTSGSNKQLQQQKQPPLIQEKQRENYLFKFPMLPVDKRHQKKRKIFHHLEKQQAIEKLNTTTTSKSRATNEQASVSILAFGGKTADEQDEHNNLKKKIEKTIDGHIETRQYNNSLVSADFYWNQIGSEPDYRKLVIAEQLDDDDEDEDVDENDTFVSSSIVKRHIRNTMATMKYHPTQMSKISDWSKLTNERVNQRAIENRSSIDFGRSPRDSKIIDSTTAKKRKLKNNKILNRNKLRESKSKTKQKIDSQTIDRNVRISRQTNTEDEDENYKIYRDLNLDDGDIESDEKHLSSLKQPITSHNQGPKSSSTSSTLELDSLSIKEQVPRNQEQDYHNLNIPQFEELVIRNGEVNTHYKPVKTSIYSLYMISWLRIFDRQQIHIVDGDRLIKEPHVELNKIENFLGLPNQIYRSQFVFNKKKNFYCARMPSGRVNLNRLLNDNSSTSWRLNSQFESNKTSQKTAGRHSSIRCLNSSKGRKHPQVDKQVIHKLRQFYAPFNRHFERLVDMRFNWPEI